ncbi:hypothetical protein PSU4_42730 [Pseudonocardia sulfidoxydans NBRC 16205]|uniref:Uncharacterized protein n=1 Tax=Pseudonocardia sulfidoxydans NBRC 16205 TaxID=1223511 RepID=A0A511DKG9_9PSEU|nr:hypothetical protein PSU4_42730 [Pseudonocardia sulfidoxydans NBRC 16205]
MAAGATTADITGQDATVEPWTTGESDAATRRVPDSARAGVTVPIVRVAASPGWCARAGTGPTGTNNATNSARSTGHRSGTRTATLDTALLGDRRTPPRYRRSVTTCPVRPAGGMCNPCGRCPAPCDRPDTSAP